MDKIYLCVKYPFESKYQVLITKDDVYENLEDYNPTKKKKVLLVFDEEIDMEANKKLGPIVIEIFVRQRKLISLVFILQSYF